MQHSFSYPGFFHFAMRLHGTGIVSTPLTLRRQHSTEGKHTHFASAYPSFSSQS